MFLSQTSFQFSCRPKHSEVSLYIIYACLITILKTAPNFIVSRQIMQFVSYMCETQCKDWLNQTHISEGQIHKLLGLLNANYKYQLENHVLSFKCRIHLKSCNSHSGSFFEFVLKKQLCLHIHTDIKNSSVVYIALTFDAKAKQYLELLQKRDQQLNEPGTKDRCSQLIKYRP